MSEKGDEMKEEIKGSNRRSFRQLVGMITAYLEGDYRRIEIWEYFTKNGMLSMSYSQFCRYIKRYIGDKSGLEQLRLRMLEPPPVNPSVKSSAPSAGIEGGNRSRKRETPRSFNHNSQAKSLNEFAFGKTEVKKDEK